MHRHKFETLLLYPPRPIYGDDTWGFLLRCDCGKTKLTRLPYGIKSVMEVHSEITNEQFNDK
jgi:hypothetical protein